MDTEKPQSSWRKALVTIVLMAISALTTMGIVSSMETRAGGRVIRESSWDNTLHSVMEPNTLHVLMRDQQLRRNYMALLDRTAHLSKSIAARYQLPDLESVSESLHEYRRSIDDENSGDRENTISKRLFGIGEGNKNDTEGTAKGFLDSLLQPLTNALSGIGNAVAGDLTGPAMFLGVGVGEGAAQGLNLASANATKQVAQKVIQDNGMDSSGLNPVVQNLGMGASASLLGAVNLSSLVGGGNINLQDLALSLAEGIGNGTASGLKLSPAAVALEPSNDTSIPNVVGTFGFGLTKTVVSNVDLSKASSGLNLSSFTGDTPLSLIALSLAEGIGNGTSTGLQLTKDPLSPPTGSSTADTLGAFGFGLTTSITRNVNISSLSSGSNFDISKIVPSLGAAALSFGQGLGNGTALGLKLTNNNVAPDTSGNDVPSAVGNFAFGLSKSVAENVNISALTSGSSFATSNTSALVAKYLPDAASGLGKGLGEGISIGLGLQPDSDTPVRAVSDGSIDAGAVAENFAKGLTSRLLANGSASKLISDLGNSTGGSGLSLPGAGSLNIGKVAQGAAMGFVQGAGDAIDAMGGLQALINGTATDPVNGLPNNTLTFNDSVNGAATGFGQGLGGQGTLVGAKLLSKVDLGSLLGSSGTKSKRSFPPMLDSVHAVDKRQVAIFNGSSGFNLSVIINANTISSALQGGVDALTCEGVGGLALIATGLMKSGVIQLDKSTSNSTSSFLKQAVPPGLIRITNSGNTYVLDGQKVVNSASGAAADGLSINGNAAIRFAVFLVIHIIVAMITFLNLIPLAIGLESTRNILIRFQMPHMLPKAPRWTAIIWLYVVPPAIVLSLIFGVLAMGSAGHFRTAHGILGLLTMILGIGAIALHFLVKVRAAEDGMIIPVPFKLTDLRTIRTATNQVLLLLSVMTGITGFADLSSISLCFTSIISLQTAVSIGFTLAGAFTFGSLLSGVDIWLGIRGLKQRDSSEGKGNKELS